jgi:hypothetical protein
MAFCVVLGRTFFAQGGMAAFCVQCLMGALHGMRRMVSGDSFRGGRSQELNGGDFAEEGEEATTAGAAVGLRLG